MVDDDPTRRMDLDDNPTRRMAPDDSLPVRGLATGSRVFGRYRLETVAGRGGMGVVWKAYDERLERTVALKLLPEAVAGDPEAIRDLKRETTRCLELTHPGIVRVYDFVEAEGLAAIAMEFVDGESLARRKTAAPNACLQLAELGPLAGQLCAALEYAHNEAKVVHRDLKPANVLMTREGKAKITDFGIAHSLSESRARLTGKEGDTSGTLPYMSPQQVRGNDPAASDDIYAVGATLYELLTGKPPFHTGDVAWQIREAAPKPVNARLASMGLDSVPAEWEETIQACLAKEPEQRPKSAADVARRLGIGASETKGQRTKRGEAPRQYAKGMRRTALFSGLAALGLGVLAYAFWLRLPRTSEDASRSNGASGKQSASTSAVSAPAENPKPVDSITSPREFVVAVNPADAEARIWLGPLSDVEVKGSKAVLKGVPDGEQELTVQAQDYQPFTTRVTVKNGSGSVEVKLVPVRGAVTITARPGTQVTAIDEHGRETRLGLVPAGGTLAVADLLTVGRYMFKIEHADCAPLELARVELMTGRTTKVAPEQIPLTGELRVFSVPTGAEVRVNGTVAGSTPVTIKNQPSEQALRVDVFQQGYRRIQESVTLKPKEARTINVGTLTAESGVLKLRITDPRLRNDGKLEFRVDGIQVAGKPSSGDAVLIEGLDVGSRMVEVTGSDYEPWRQAVTVRDMETTTANVVMMPKPGTSAFAEAETATAVAKTSAKLSAILAKLHSAEEGQPWTVPELNLEMVYIRPGNCTMGSPLSELSRGSDEGPQTQVTLTHGYWLGKTEVTQGQYETVMGTNPSKFRNAGKDAPVERVSWNDAMEFCRKLTERERASGRLQDRYSYTLPTEAQWEYACRAGSESAYSGDVDAMAWHASVSGGQTHPVGQKRPNAWGLCDMHGNVWEWCFDWYVDHLTGGAITDPTGPDSGINRVLHGGSWDSLPQDCRSAYRGRDLPDDHDSRVGFRLALGPVARSGSQSQVAPE